MDEYTNKLYEDFKTRDVLDGISADNFDSLKNDAFIVPENKKFFEDMLRIGWLSGQLSSSGPMPNTGKIVTTQFTAASQTKTVASANAGEVWQVMGASANRVSASGSFTFVLNFTDGVNFVRIESLSGSGNNEFNITSTAGPMYIDENISLSVVSSGGSFPSDVDILIALQRVR